MTQPNPEIVAHYAAHLRAARHIAREGITQRAQYMAETDGRSAKCYEGPDHYRHTMCSGLFGMEWPTGGSLGCLCECHDPQDDDRDLRAILRDHDAWLAENDPNRSSE